MPPILGRDVWKALTDTKASPHDKVRGQNYTAQFDYTIIQWDRQESERSRYTHFTAVSDLLTC